MRLYPWRVISHTKFLHDGGNIGAFIGDASRPLRGCLGKIISSSGFPVNPPFCYMEDYPTVLAGGDNRYTVPIFMDVSSVWPIANEFRPGAIVVSAYISY